MAGAISVVVIARSAKSEWKGVRGKRIAGRFPRRPFSLGMDMPSVTITQEAPWVIEVSALVLSLLMALSAAAPPGSAGPLAHANPPPPPVHHIADVPQVERNTNWCGPAALAAVLRNHGEEIAAGEIADDIYLPHYRGSLNLDLLIYARKRGFEVWANEGSVDAIRMAIARDRPVICMVRRGNVVARRNHYVVVTGYDCDRRLWFLDSGNGREEIYTEADFDREWSNCNHWMLVVEGKTPTMPAPNPAAEEN